MKKFLAVVFGVAVATSLAMPVYAKHHKKAKDGADASSTQGEKSHKKHGKKKGDMSMEHPDAPKQ